MHLAEVGEAVGVDGFKDFAVDFVEIRIALGECDGVFVEIDGGHVCGGAEGGGVDAEAAGVAAEVEDVGAVGELGEVEAIVALVAEESGFVAVGEIDLESDFIFGDDDGLAISGAFDLGTGGGVGADGKSLGSLDAFIGARDDFGDAEEFFELGADCVESAEHGEAEEFDDGAIAEAVDHDAWELIPFGVDDAIGVGEVVEAERFAAEFDCGGEPVGEE